MPVFLTLTDADILDPAFWAAQVVDTDSTINVSGVSDNFQITMTASSIVITDTNTSTVTTFTDTDLAGGSFSEFVQYIGNDADSDISGSVGLNSQGYTGGTGNDTFTDSGNLGGPLNGGDGDDILIGGTGSNNISGGAGNDILTSGGSGNDILLGGDGNDTLTHTGTSTGNLVGGAGDDTIHAGGFTDFVDGGTGTDTLYVPVGSTISPFSPTGGNVTTPDGQSFTYLNIENVFIECFTAGTVIRTPSGEIPIETLSIGDKVTTLDHGNRPIKWIGKRTVPAQGNLAPILFAKGAIGNTRELLVSPQHRILINNWRAELLFGEAEVLVAAKHLVNDKDICRVIGGDVTYIHIMFDQHEIVFAEGAPSESFYPGQTSMSQMETEVRDEIFKIFPELEKLDPTLCYPPARPFLKGFEARALF